MVSDRGLQSQRSEGRFRRVLRRAALALALTGFALFLLILITGGFDFYLFDLRVRMHRPVRALWIGVIGLASFIALGGRLPQTWKNALALLGQRLEHRWLALKPWWPSSRTAALCLAAGTSAWCFVHDAKVGTGSDSYGYVSQADLWLRGRLETPQPFAAQVPWPDGPHTFTPLGYTSVERDGVPSLVPTYPSGLPLMLAAAKSIGGHDAMFLVVPLLSGVLVLATYGIGCRLGSPASGLIGAVLVATSPVVLFMMTMTMTDVPVAALWAATFYVMTGRGRGQALFAGLIAALAIMIRPNHVPLALVAGLYYAFGMTRHETRGQAFRDGLLFSVGVLPGIAAVGVINNHLYGSPLLSGYGTVEAFFDLTYILPNLTRYFTWLVETQSPVVLVGLAALFLPVPWLWPGLTDRRRLVMAALFVSTTWALYMAYLVFDAWWYLRFLLTSWPFMMVGVGAVALAWWNAGVRAVRIGAAGGIVALLLFQLGVARDFSVFDHGTVIRRDVAAAQMVRRLTPRNSVVLSLHQSGTIRYYGGRMTLRYDILNPAWLDRAIAWLDQRGVRTYLLVESWEVDDVTTRFAASYSVARLDAPPLAIYDYRGQMLLFDLSGIEPSSSTPELVTGVDDGFVAARPVDPPTLAFQALSN